MNGDWKWMTLTALALLAAGCHERRVLLQRQFPAYGWAMPDSVVNVVATTVVDTAPQQLVLELIADESYPFRNLYIKYRMGYADSAATQGLAQLILSDSTGQWAAPGTWWGTYRLKATLANEVRLAPGKRYTFSLTQWMRPDTLRGLRHLELYLSPAR